VFKRDFGFSLFGDGPLSATISPAGECRKGGQKQNHLKPESARFLFLGEADELQINRKSLTVTRVIVLGGNQNARKSAVAHF
jgi:hypothetical protein